MEGYSLYTVVAGFGVCSVAGAIINRCKGYPPGKGFLLGLCLGPLGLLFCLLAGKDDKQPLETRLVEGGSMKICPLCAELIKQEAMLCRFCGYVFTREWTPEAAGIATSSAPRLSGEGWADLMPSVMPGSAAAAPEKA